MNPKNLPRALELAELIKQTERALRDIVPLKNISPSKDDRYYKDGTYGLHLSNRKDGSGIHVDLSRYTGNKELIIIIESALQAQLKNFQDEVETL